MNNDEFYRKYNSASDDEKKQMYLESFCEIQNTGKKKSAEPLPVKESKWEYRLWAFIVGFVLLILSYLING